MEKIAGLYKFVYFLKKRLTDSEVAAVASSFCKSVSNKNRNIASKSPDANLLIYLHVCTYFVFKNLSVRLILYHSTASLEISAPYCHSDTMTKNLVHIPYPLPIECNNVSCIRNNVCLLQNMEAYTDHMIVTWDQLLQSQLSGDVKKVEYGCPGEKLDFCFSPEILALCQYKCSTTCIISILEYNQNSLKPFENFKETSRSMKCRYALSNFLIINLQCVMG